MIILLFGSTLCLAFYCNITLPRIDRSCSYSGQFRFVTNKDYCCFSELNRRLEDNNNFTVCYFTDEFPSGAAVFVFHFQIAVNLSDEAWKSLIWFTGLVCTKRGIATVQPVVRSGRSGWCFLQSDVVLVAIRPVPHNTPIDIITVNLLWTLQVAELGL